MVDQWNRKLAEFARRVRGTPYVWGDTDCVSIVRRGLEIIHGHDVLAPEIPRVWTTRREAMRAYLVVPSYEESLRRTGAREVVSHMATAGDVALGGVSSEHGLRNIMLLVPGEQVLVSDLGGVELVRQNTLAPSVRFFRHG